MESAGGVPKIDKGAFYNRRRCRVTCSMLSFSFCGKFTFRVVDTLRIAVEACETQKEKLKERRVVRTTTAACKNERQCEVANHSTPRFPPHETDEEGRNGYRRQAVHIRRLRQTRCYSDEPINL